MKKSLLTFLLQFFAAGFVNAQSLLLPYYTGFDSPSELAGWQEFRTGTLSNYSWNIGGGGFSVPSSLGHDYNVGGASTDTVIDWYVSPPVNFTSNSKIALKVQTSGFSTPFPDNCELWFGTGNKNPSIGNFVLLANLSYMLPQFVWLDTVILNSSVSDSGYIAFKYKTIGAAWSTYAIDNINISIDSNVSVNENNFSKENPVRIFQNPINLSTTILIDDNLLNTPLDIIMSDIFGREIKQLSAIHSKEVIINSDNLPAGIYFIDVSQGSKMIISGKIIID